MVRQLPVGDFAWVVRRRGAEQDGTEAVLDCVVERKRVDDLASSLTDGRYREQKVTIEKPCFYFNYAENYEDVFVSYCGTYIQVQMYMYLK